jgi:TolB-like protein/class 3 adenylate cyclase/Flp pilus assembly protein TadD
LSEEFDQPGAFVAEEPTRKLAVLLHADVVGSTALVQANETLAHQRIQDTFQRFSETIVNHGGLAHEIRGDALVAEFAKASDAVSASLEFQERNTTYVEELLDEVRPVVRVGIAMGEVVIADHTVTGEGIVLAQRLEQLAVPGGVCIQGAAYDTVPKRLPFTHQDLGVCELKGFEEPIRAYSVHTESEVDTMPPQTGAAAGSTESSSKLSIVVLPFTNMSGDVEQEYFSDGITEDIITELSRYSELLVAARNSAFTYKGKAVNVQEVGRELGVAYVLEGSVRKAGNRIRVTAQVIDAASGNHIWAERYDRDLDDIFAVQDELSRAIVSVLPARVHQSLIDTASHKPTTDLTAYDLYLRGRWLYDQGAGEDPRALELFEQAIKVDPQCAHAYASLAEAYSYSQYSLRSPLPDYDRKAKAYMEKALANAEGNAWIHATAAKLYTSAGEHQLARIHADKAVALNRNDVTVINAYGFVLSNSGEKDDSLSWLQEAKRLDPLSPAVWLEDLAECHYMLGNYQCAIDLYLSWRNPPLHTYTHLAACYVQLGRMTEAQEAVANYEREKPADTDFPRYAAAHCRLCLRQEDADHWMEGYRKAGLVE